MEMKNNSSLYNRAFFEVIKMGSYRSAEIVVPIVLDIVGKIDSVLDAGCGVGAWLSVFNKLGSQTVIGLDGDYVERDQLLINEDDFIATDLTKPFNLGRVYDLVLSLEVAEHLPKDCAEPFIDSLCAHSDVVLFSAAVPGQGGTNHINEAPLSYWVSLFAKNEYYPIDCIREKIWDNDDVVAHFRQNTLLFAHKRSRMYQKNYVQHVGPLDIIHPSIFTYRLHERQMASLFQAMDVGALLSELCRQKDFVMIGVLRRLVDFPFLDWALRGEFDDGFMGAARLDAEDEHFLCPNAGELPDEVRRLLSHKPSLSGDEARSWTVDFLVPLYEAKRVIFYGAGGFVEYVKQACDSLGVQAVCIWDQRADEIGTRLGMPVEVPFCEAPDEAMLVVVALDAFCNFYPVCQKLQEKGYRVMDGGLLRQVEVWKKV